MGAEKGTLYFSVKVECPLFLSHLRTSFVRGFVSGALTATFVIGSGGVVPLPAASTIAEVGSGLFVDLVFAVSGVGRTREEIVGGIFINALTGLAAGLVVGKVFDALGEAVPNAMQVYIAAKNDKAYALSELAKRVGILVPESQKAAARSLYLTRVAEINRVLRDSLIVATGASATTSLAAQGIEAYVVDPIVQLWVAVEVILKRPDE